MTPSTPYRPPQPEDRMTMETRNVARQHPGVSHAERASLLVQTPRCVWFTGLSGAGKSTLANALQCRLQAEGRHVYVLDGDKLRQGLNRDLGFTAADRVENVRRVAEVAHLMLDAGLTVIVSLISPFRAERRMARARFGPGEFIEVFVDTPLAECERRDTKGLYARARLGELSNFTGLDSPYEAPEAPEVRLDTSAATVEDCIARVRDQLG
jgi:bifunctional enzyme CysN/CysC